jgi:hypothetical protein
MSETIEFELVRPVNPTGSSFIHYVWGAVAARNRAVLQEHRRVLARLVQRLGFAIEDKIGSNKLITGKIAVYVENGKPMKIVARDIQIWQASGTLEGEVSTRAISRRQVIFVLGGTGLSSDNVRIHEPYIYSRRLAELRFCESVEELADKVCFWFSCNRESF